MTLPVILTDIVQLENYKLRTENILKTALFRLRWGQSKWAVLVIEFMHLPSKKTKSHTGFWCEHEITCRVVPGFCNELILSTWWETEWYQTKQSQKKTVDILAIPSFGHQPPLHRNQLPRQPMKPMICAQEKLCMPHGAPGVKFYAFEGVDAGKEPIRVQRYLENDGEKSSTKLPENGGVVSGGQWHQNPGLVFFSLCDFSISTSFAEIFSMFILHSVIQQCINSFLHWSIVLCMVQCILCFICLFFISSNIFLIH